MSLPPAVQKHLQRENLGAGGVACLSFDSDWRLTARSGAVRELGLDGDNQDVLERQFRELCHGQSPTRGGRVPQVNLGNGHYADLHLVGEEQCFHVAVVDVSERLLEEQALQQRAQENKLRSYQQGRQLRELRQQLLLVEAERDAARAQVLELAMQAELQGQRLQGALDRVDSEVRRLLQLEPGQGGRQRAELLLEQALAQIGHLSDDARQALARLVPQAPIVADSENEELDIDQLAAELFRGLRRLIREQGVKLDLRTHRRSADPLRFATGSVLQTCQLALWQTILRSPGGDIASILRWDGQFLQLQIESSAADFEPALADALWDQKLPADDAGPGAMVLFALGRVLHRHGGRALAQPLPQGLRLLVSLPARVMQESGGDITAPNFRGPVWLFSADKVYGAEMLAEFGARGVDLRQHEVDERELRHALEAAPPAILFDLDVNPEAAVLAFKLRVRGFAGALIALGGPDPKGSALSATWRMHLPRSASAKELLRMLSLQAS